MTTKHEVIAVHRDHPEWTSGRIAGHLHCTPEYVSATFRRNGLKLPNSGKKCYVDRFENQRERYALIAENLGSDIIAAAIREDRRA